MYTRLVVYSGSFFLNKMRRERRRLVEREPMRGPDSDANDDESAGCRESAGAGRKRSTEPVKKKKY